MIDAALYWLGVFVAIVGSVGVSSVVVMWSLDRLLQMNNLTTEFLSWYGQKLIRERDAKRRRG